METEKKPSLLERFLKLFTDVRAGEGATALLLVVDLYLLLAAYYIAKAARDGLILSEVGGAELKIYSAAGQTLLLLGVVPLYAGIASRLKRRRLINSVTLFFTVCLVVFSYLLAHPHLGLSVSFYLWVGIFNVMVIAQLWSYANDLYLPDEGKRLFPMVMVGASVGAISGSILTHFLSQSLPVRELLLVSAGILAGSLLFTNVVESRERHRATAVAAARAAIAETPIGGGGAFRLVLRSRYLLLIALLILFLNWVNTTGEYILGKTVKAAAEAAVPSGTSGGLSKEMFIVRFTADLHGTINFVALLTQLFLVSRIFKYLGVRVALFFLPVISLGGYALLTLAPVLGVIRWVKTAENSTDYSLNNTVRQALFLPTTREQKYKAKQVTDSFCQRAGDLLSAGLVFVGTTWLGFGARQFSIMNVCLAAVWIALATLIAREHAKLTSNGAPRASGAP